MKTTIKSFASSSHIPETIIRAVIRQLGGFDSFKEHASDITNHGANGGFSGFIYYSDTVAFTKRNKKAIIAFAKDQADQMGNDSVSYFVASFNCIKLSIDEVAQAIYSRNSDDKQEVYNALAWYVLEEVARSFVEFSNN